ncbi:MAG: DUF1553 domain-containing protein, partial [Planctomycetaceae bacterium]
MDYHTAGNATFERLPDGSLLSDGNAPENDTYFVSFRAPLPRVASIRLRVLPHESLPKNGPGTASNGNFVLSGIELRIGEKTVPFADAWADHEQPRFAVRKAIDGDGQTGWAINTSAEQRKKNPKLQMNAPHEAAFVLAEPLDATDETITIVLKHEHERNPNYLIGRFAIDVSSATVPDDETAPTGELTEVRQRIAELETRIPNKGEPVAQMIMADKTEPPATYRLVRGDFLNPDTGAGPLAPGVPAVLLHGEAPAFRNRLDLARWLVNAENPLTARVMVNRIWMRYFGRGLVETENDFGYQGTPPTHPQMLDWLASEFASAPPLAKGGPGGVAPDSESGFTTQATPPSEGGEQTPHSALRTQHFPAWSLKRLHRLIVTSATYRQASGVRPDLAAADPGNLLLGRQSRFRVEAEIVRDMALASSGALVRHIGGPSVFPPLPDGV